MILWIMNTIPCISGYTRRRVWHIQTQWCFVLGGDATAAHCSLRPESKIRDFWLTWSLRQVLILWNRVGYDDALATTFGFLLCLWCIHNPVVWHPFSFNLNVPQRTTMVEASTTSTKILFLLGPQLIFLLGPRLTIVILSTYHTMVSMVTFKMSRRLSNNRTSNGSRGK